MRVRQRVSFILFSTQVSAAEITARLGLEPDRIGVRGSRRPTPPVPRCHSWRITCDDRGLAVDDQLARVVARLASHKDRIGLLARELRAGDPQHGGAAMAVARYFDTDEGEEEELSPPDEPLQKLPGQHQLLGWVLDRDVLEFLLAVDAILDVDEYG